MTTVSTTPVLAPQRRTIARDFATAAMGTAFAGVFGVLQVFLVPRLLSVEDFGYWRLFTLYGGYTAIIHMGFADGALLRWAGKPLGSFRSEVGAAVRFLWLQHIAVILPACALAWLALGSRPELRVVAIGCLLFSIVLNTVTLLQFAAQAARRFVPFAVANAAPMGGFVLLTFAWRTFALPRFQVLIALYAIAWAAVGVYLWNHLRPAFTALFRIRDFGKALVLAGWPVMLANTGLSVAQSADRLVLSSAVSITAFAQYNLAQSTMYVPVTLMTAVSRVFFPHLAATETDRRAGTYRRASRILVMCWSLLLPYYFVLDVFVRRVLPKYESSLGIAPLLLLAMLFFGLVQVLQSSFYNVCGRQREFFISSLYAVIVAFGLGYGVAYGFHSLRLVAACQIVVAILWWFRNEWHLRSITQCSRGEWLQTVAIFACSAAVLFITARVCANAWLRIPLYYVLIALPVSVAFSSELKILANGLRMRFGADWVEAEK